MDIGTLTGAVVLQDQLSGALNTMTTHVDKFIKRFDDSMAGSVISVGKMVTAVGVTLVGAITGAIAAVVALGSKGSTLLGVEEAFDRLAIAAGSTGAALIGGLSAGVKNTIDSMELMQITTRLLSSGMQVTATQMESLGATARELAKATGTDAASALNTLSSALTTGNDRALKRLGIHVNLVEAEKKFASSLGTTRDQLSQTGILEARRGAMLSAMEAHLEKVGRSELSFKERIQQSQVAIGNWFDELQRGVARSSAVTNAFDTIWTSLQRTFGPTSQLVLQTLLRGIDEFANAIARFGPAVIEVFGTITEKLMTLGRAIGPALQQLVGINIDTFKTVGPLIAAAFDTAYNAILKLTTAATPALVNLRSVVGEVVTFAVARIKDFWQWLVDFNDRWQITSTIVAGARVAWNILATAFDLVKFAVNAVMDAWKALPDWLKRITQTALESALVVGAFAIAIDGVAAPIANLVGMLDTAINIVGNFSTVIYNVAQLMGERGGLLPAVGILVNNFEVLGQTLLKSTLIARAYGAYVATLAGAQGLLMASVTGLGAVFGRLATFIGISTTATTVNTTATTTATFASRILTAAKQLLTAALINLTVGFNALTLRMGISTAALSITTAATRTLTASVSLLTASLVTLVGSVLAVVTVVGLVVGAIYLFVEILKKAWQGLKNVGNLIDAIAHADWGKVFEYDPESLAFVGIHDSAVEAAKAVKALADEEQKRRQAALTGASSAADLVQVTDDWMKLSHAQRDSAVAQLEYGKTLSRLRDEHQELTTAQHVMANAYESGATQMKALNADVRALGGSWNWTTTTFPQLQKIANQMKALADAGKIILNQGELAFVIKFGDVDVQTENVTNNVKKLGETWKTSVDQMTQSAREIAAGFSELDKIEAFFKNLSPAMRANIDVQNAYVASIHQLAEAHRTLTPAMNEVLEAERARRLGFIADEKAILSHSNLTQGLVDQLKRQGQSEADIARQYGVTTAGLSNYLAEQQRAVQISHRLDDAQGRLIGTIGAAEQAMIAAARAQKGMTSKDLENQQTDANLKISATVLEVQDLIDQRMMTSTALRIREIQRQEAAVVAQYDKEHALVGIDLEDQIRINAQRGAFADAQAQKSKELITALTQDNDSLRAHSKKTLAEIATYWENTYNAIIAGSSEFTEAFKRETEIRMRIAQVEADSGGEIKLNAEVLLEQEKLNAAHKEAVDTLDEMHRQNSITTDSTKEYGQAQLIAAQNTVTLTAAAKAHLPVFATTGQQLGILATGFQELAKVADIAFGTVREKWQQMVIDVVAGAAQLFTGLDTGRKAFEAYRAVLTKPIKEGGHGISIDAVKMIKDFGIATPLFDKHAKGAEKMASGVASAAQVYGGAMEAYSAGANSGSKAVGALGGALAGAKAGAAFGPWGAAIGAAAGAVIGFVGALGAGRKAVKEFAASFDTAAAGSGFDELHEKLMKIVGGEQLWINLTQKSKNKSAAVAAAEEIRKALAALDSDVKKYNLTIDDMVKKEFNGAVAGRELAESFKRLTTAGYTQEAVVKGMNVDLNAYIANSLAAGSKIPPAMQPIIEKLIRMGGLTKENARAMLGLAADTMPSLADITAAADRYGISLDQLGPKVMQLKITELADQYVTDWGILTAATDDWAVIIDAMKPKVQSLILDAIKYGSELPASMKPMIEAFIKAGQLVDENGDALTDLSQLTFAADLEKMFEDLITKLDELIDKITGGVANALDDLGNMVVSPTVRPVYDDSAVPGNFGGSGDVGGQNQNPGYAASGGFVTSTGIVPLKPRGTDTVPAMLTPGETIIPAGAAAVEFVKPVYLGEGGRRLFSEEYITPVYGAMADRVLGAKEEVESVYLDKDVRMLEAEEYVKSVYAVNDGRELTAQESVRSVYEATESRMLDAEERVRSVYLQEQQRQLDAEEYVKSVYAVTDGRELTAKETAYTIYDVTNGRELTAEERVTSVYLAQKARELEAEEYVKSVYAVNDGRELKAKETVTSVFTVDTEAAEYNLGGLIRRTDETIGEMTGNWHDFYAETAEAMHDLERRMGLEFGSIKTFSGKSLGEMKAGITELSSTPVIVNTTTAQRQFEDLERPVALVKGSIEGLSSTPVTTDTMAAQRQFEDLERPVSVVKGSIEGLSSMPVTTDTIDAQRQFENLERPVSTVTRSIDNLSSTPVTANTTDAQRQFEDLERPVSSVKTSINILSSTPVTTNTVDAQRQFNDLERPVISVKRSIDVLSSTPVTADTVPAQREFNTLDGVVNTVSGSARVLQFEARTAGMDLQTAGLTGVTALDGVSTSARILQGEFGTVHNKTGEVIAELEQPIWAGWGPAFATTIGAVNTQLQIVLGTIYAIHTAISTIPKMPEVPKGPTVPGAPTTPGPIVIGKGPTVPPPPPYFPPRIPVPTPQTPRIPPPGGDRWWENVQTARSMPTPPERPEALSVVVSPTIETNVSLEGATIRDEQDVSKIAVAVADKLRTDPRVREVLGEQIITVIEQARARRRIS